MMSIAAKSLQDVHQKARINVMLKPIAKPTLSLLLQQLIQLRQIPAKLVIQTVLQVNALGEVEHVQMVNAKPVMEQTPQLKNVLHVQKQIVLLVQQIILNVIRVKPVMDYKEQLEMLLLLVSHANLIRLALSATMLLLSRLLLAQLVLKALLSKLLSALLELQIALLQDIKQLIPIKLSAQLARPDIIQMLLMLQLVLLVHLHQIAQLVQQLLNQVYVLHAPLEED